MFIFRLDMKMKEFTVFGFKQSNYLPIMVKSLLEPTVDSSLLDIKFEINPLDKKCDQRVDVHAYPLQIVYDAETIIQLLHVFKMPSHANLSEFVSMSISWQFLNVSPNIMRFIYDFQLGLRTLPPISYRISKNDQQLAFNT